MSVVCAVCHVIETLAMLYTISVLGARISAHSACCRHAQGVKGGVRPGVTMEYCVIANVLREFYARISVPTRMESLF